MYNEFDTDIQCEEIYDEEFLEDIVDFFKTFKELYENTDQSETNN